MVISFPAQITLGWRPQRTEATSRLLKGAVGAGRDALQAELRVFLPRTYYQMYHTASETMKETYDNEHINTILGTKFRPCDPQPAEIALVDIAHGLAHNCRLVGQSRIFYSLAQHSLNVSQALGAVEDASPEHQLYGLLHDASEAYLSDVPGMVKDRFVHYREAEDAIMTAVWEWSNLGQPGVESNKSDESPETSPWKDADYGVLQVEGNELLTNFEPDSELVERYSDCVTIEPGDDFSAVRQAFVDRAETLSDACNDSVHLRAEADLNAILS